MVIAFLHALDGFLIANDVSRWSAALVRGLVDGDVEPGLLSVFFFRPGLRRTGGDCREKRYRERGKER